MEVMYHKEKGGRTEMTFLGIVIILVLVYLLIIRPLTRNRYTNPYSYRPPTYGPQGGPYYGSPDYANGWGGGIGRGLGMMAGGFAAGALLTYLLEQGRINADQFDYFNSLDQAEMIRQLQEQNILQQHEIDELMNRMDHENDDGMYGRDDGGFDNYDDPGYQDNGYDDSGFSDGYDDNNGNWV
jgi:hypothetical protein